MRDLLPELMHGTLGADAQRAVEAHVASCTECAEELALLRALRPALSRGPALNVERIAAAVQARVRAPAWRASPWHIAVAAAVVLAAGGVGYLAIARARAHQPEIARHTVTAPPTAAPAPAPTAPSAQTATPPQEVVVAPVHTPAAGSAIATVAESDGVIGNLSDLSDDDVRALTASIDAMSAVPDATPGPTIDPLGAALDELPAGGR
jgi:CubicO group peptidase (beta-lactamase class C family)